MAPRQRSLNSQSSAYDESESSPLSEDGKKITRKPSTLNQIEADISRDRHDYFNLIALIPVIVTTVLNYNCSDLRNMNISYSGDFFWMMWVTTGAYFLLDLVWVARVPICVKSPGLIIKHHILAMIYLLGPIAFPEYRWFMGSILSVEVNTWFLICRRVVYKASGKPITPFFPQFISAMFYITWIWIRCIVYPGVLFQFLGMAKEAIEETGIFWHMPMIFIPPHFALCMLNLKWTYDLFRPIVKRWMGLGPKSIAVQNGL